MSITEIKTKEDYDQALKRMEEIWGAQAGTPEDDELDLLATLIDQYEELHFPIGNEKE